jgi:signal transduction histidine kinase
MTGDFLLDWATLTISIFNTILLLWLGLTVLLNSEHRTLGVWVAGGGLLTSSVFFLSHSAILGLGPLQTEAGMNLWWKTGWFPVISMPFAWYLVMLWYASYWGDTQSPIHLRHQLPLILATLLAISTVGLVLLFNSLPTFNQLIQLDLGGVLSVGGIPVLMVIYPIYLTMCIGFSLDVLLHPGSPTRLMGQLARQRARPWLIIATLSLLLVSLLVGAFILWGIYSTNQGIIYSKLSLIISRFDLAIDLLIAVTILSIGQAIVSYEIFTGKVLPSQGLKRYWKLACIFSLIFGVIVSWALVYQLQSIYLLLLSIVLTTSIYAVLSWRSFAEQERYIKTLRPFIRSQHLYDQLLLQKPNSSEVDFAGPFRALCKDILGVKQAILIPMGIFGPLVGDEISYPMKIDINGNEDLLSEIRRTLTTNSSFTPFLLSDFKLLKQNSLVISLWSERGLIGALVLGEKENSSLFTQEEIEVARTVGERLIDNQASAELARRLMDLQRQHLSETNVIDQHTRRNLHDEILPRLQSAMIKLSSTSNHSEDVINELSELHHQLTALMRELPTIHESKLGQQGLIKALQVTIENEFRPYFDSLTWQIEDFALDKVSSIPAFASEVLYHATREAVRNAARHGRLPENDHTFNLLITMSWMDRLIIKIQDDGIGFKSKRPFKENSGQGLALHSTLVAVIGGSLAIESTPDRSTSIILKYPA